MRRGLKIAAAIVVVLGAIGLVLGRGPVGAESVAGIELAERLEAAATRAGATLSPATLANPDLLTLPRGLERKRRVKRFLGTVGLIAPAPERAMQFTLTE